MTEDLFQYIWKMKLFDTSSLNTCDGEKVEIIHPGSQNLNSGPDFFNARIKVGNTQWAGNIELHVRASEWYQHKHQNDEAYDNIILHVVYINDKPIIDKQGKLIRTLALKNYISPTVFKNYQDIKLHKGKIPCENRIQTVPQSYFQAYLESLVVERLERKSSEIEKILQENNYNWEYCFYIQLAANFGFKTNHVPFEILARSTPLMVLSKHKQNLSQIEAILFGQAGFLNERFEESYPIALQNEYAYLQKKYNLKGIPEHIWKLSKLRPVNFPTIRVAQFAALVHQSSHLFSKIIEAENAAALIKLFQLKASPFWDDHYHFQSRSKKSKKNLGQDAICNILINTVAPFVFVYGRYYGNENKMDLALRILDTLAAEKNHIINFWKGLGIKVQNALQSQAVIELKNNYCLPKKCLQCSIGHYILKNN